MLVDYHLHLRDRSAERSTTRSRRSSAYVEAARERGVDEIGFTEHVYYFRQTSDFWDVPYQPERCVHDLERYCDVVVEAKRRGLPVKLGLEVDYVPGRAGRARASSWRRIRGTTCSARCTGSTGSPSTGEPRLLGGRSASRRSGALYFASSRAPARSGHFDVLAHPDLVKIFGERADSGLPAGDRRALDRGSPLEVSTAGLHKPVGELYPHPDAPRCVRRREIRSRSRSDAHVAAVVGRDFDRARELLRSARLRDRHGLRAAHGAAGAARLSDYRVGIGVDAHALDDGVPLVLGGVDVRVAARARRPLRRRRDHARADRRDARRGGARRHRRRCSRPTGDTWQASPRSICSRGARRRAGAGYAVVNADCILIGEEPRLAPYGASRCASARRSVRRRRGPVAVRATTTDHLGFTGRGEGLAAQAVALLSR